MFNAIDARKKSLASVRKVDKVVEDSIFGAFGIIEASDAGSLLKLLDYTTKWAQYNGRLSISIDVSGYKNCTLFCLIGKLTDLGYSVSLIRRYSFWAKPKRFMEVSW